MAKFFSIENGCTVIFSVLAWFAPPLCIASARLITKEDRECALHRVQADALANESHFLSSKHAAKVFKHPVAIRWMLIEICIGLPFNSIGNWFPHIADVLGKSTVQTYSFAVARNI